MTECTHYDVEDNHCTEAEIVERESEAQRVAALTPDEKMDEDARLHTLEAAVEKQKAEYVWIIGTNR